MEHPARPLAPCDRLLIVRLGAAGDVIRAIPAAHALKQAYPTTHLAWVVEDLSRPLLEGHPDVDEVIRFPRRELSASGRGPRQAARSWRQFRDQLRENRFSVAVDLQASFKSGLLAWLSGARRRVGFEPRECREMSFLFSNERVTLSSPHLNRVERNLQVAQALGANASEIALPVTESPGEEREAAAILARLEPRGDRTVILSPGASRRQAFKMWPAENYARLAELLSARLGVQAIVVWGPGEESLARRVVDSSRGAALLAPATSLRILASMLRRADLFIGADTGPMHLAWSVGAPVIALFGPTDPRLNSPLGPADIVLRGADGRIDRVEPEIVLDAAVRLLGDRRTRRDASAGVVSLPRRRGAVV